MKSKLMLLLSVVIVFLFCSCPSEGYIYSQMGYSEKLETGIWESEPVSFTQDGTTYEDEIIQISVDNDKNIIIFRFKNSGIVSLPTEYDENSLLIDPYNPESHISILVTQENNVLTKLELSSGFFFRGLENLVAITKVSSVPETWETNYVPVSNVEDFVTGENQDGTLFLSSYVGNDPYIVIPEEIDGKKITRIASRAFDGWTSNRIYGLILPETITAIEDYAFCSLAVRSMIIPDSVTELGNIFSECSNLQDLKIGAGAQILDIQPFFRNLNLSSLEISEDNPYIKTESGMIFSKDGKNLQGFVPNLVPSTLIIPATVEVIEEDFLNDFGDFFSSNPIVTSIIIENANITFPTFFSCYETEIKIVGSTVTFASNVDAKKITIENSTVSAEGGIQSLTSLFINNSTIDIEQDLTVSTEIRIKDSTIYGELATSLYGKEDIPYSVTIENSEIESVRIFYSECNLASLDLSGLTANQVRIGLGDSEKTLRFEEIKLPKEVRDQFTFSIGKGIKIDKIYLPHYNTIFEDSAMSPSLWGFSIDNDSEVNVIEIASGYLKDPVYDGNIEIFNSVPQYSGEHYSAREAIFFVPEKSSFDISVSDGVEVYWGLGIEWEYNENGVPQKIGGSTEPEEPGTDPDNPGTDPDTPDRAELEYVQSLLSTGVSYVVNSSTIPSMRPDGVTKDPDDMTAMDYTLTMNNVRFEQAGIQYVLYGTVEVSTDTSSFSQTQKINLTSGTSLDGDAHTASWTSVMGTLSDVVVDGVPLD